MTRRGLDVVVSAVGLALLSPVLLVIAVALKLTDPREPVLFHQQRVGRAGTTFTIVKFRTMRTARVGSAVTARDDPRVTRVGAVLRRWRLDELPQLYNVLHGEMSLVGPRPEVPELFSRWPPELQAAVKAVKPGITDPAAIEFLDEESLLDPADPEGSYLRDVVPIKGRLYTAYLARRTVRTDLVVLGRTARALVRSTR